MEVGMKTLRTAAETRALKEEAERRARRGESLAEIARTISVPTSTLSDWALKGGWRRKDLLPERSNEIVRLAAMAVAQQGEPARAETGPAGAAAPSGDPWGEFTAIAMAKVLLDRGHLDAAEKAIRIASRFVAVHEQIQRRVFQK
jgi:hypothetical protein